MSDFSDFRRGDCVQFIGRDPKGMKGCIGAVESASDPERVGKYCVRVMWPHSIAAPAYQPKDLTKMIQRPAEQMSLLKEEA